MLHKALLFLHIAGAMIWIGGMFFAYFCLRPAAAAILEPPQRLPLWASTFRLFLRYAAISVIALLASGFGLLLPVGLGAVAHGWMTMMAAGVAMALIFAWVYGVLYTRLVKAVKVSAWKDAATALNAIRRLVAVNLILSLVVIVAAVSAR